ncbi:MAG: PfkB family carbohydrate kinase [Metamycoplasmataceae bacterium]
MFKSNKNRFKKDIINTKFGEDGSYLINENKILKIDVPKIKTINATGAGDSMLASFTANFITTNNLEESFILGNTAGMPAAASPWLVTFKKINEYKKLLKIKEIKNKTYALFFLLFKIYYVTYYIYLKLNQHFQI